MAGEQRDRTLLNVTEEYHLMRADLALSEILQISRSQAQKLIKLGGVKVDGSPIKPKDSVSQNQQIEISHHDIQPSPELNPCFVPLDIVFEDESLIVINKAAGVTVHPGAGTTEPTLIEGVLHYLSKSPEQLPGDVQRPGIVHRLDKDTSGVMVVAKDAKAHEHLAEQFRQKTNLREYFAVLRGRMQDDVTAYKSYLYRDPRHRTRYKSMSLADFEERSKTDKSTANFRFAQTTFFKKKTYGDHISLAQIRLHTGRTHQIRVHAKALKHPIIGDQLYGDGSKWPPSIPGELRSALASAKRQMLHARLLGFTHPITEERLGFEVPFPDDIKELIGRLETHLK